MPLDPGRFSTDMEACQAPLLLYARQFLAPAQAQEVVQEAFVRLLSQSAPPSDVRAWLFRTVRNLAISQGRSERRRRDREAALARPDWFEPCDADLIDAADAQAALESLDPGLREIVVLRIWVGMTLAQVAALTGLAVSSVFDRYKAALAQIKQRMQTPCHKTTPT